MALARNFIANDTYDAHVVELPKCFGLFALALELHLAQAAPGLEVVWIVTVLNEAKRLPFKRQEVLAHYRSTALPMGTAIHKQGFRIRHCSSWGLTPH